MKKKELKKPKNLKKLLFNMMFNSTPQQRYICNIIVKNDLSLLRRSIEENQISLNAINDDVHMDRLVNSILSSESTVLTRNSSFNEFDLLIFAIKCNVSLSLIKYIVEKTPYTDFNYGRMENKNNFDVPLFIALANNRFDIADYLRQGGAKLDYEFCSPEFQVDEDYRGYLEYCGYIEPGLFDGNSYYHIKADVYRYWSEFYCINEQNVTYLVKNGYFIDYNLKESLSNNRIEDLELIQTVENNNKIRNNNNNSDVTASENIDMNPNKNKNKEN